jgi:solute carrier family 25 carnitine/acylcarnitine transporter 20/29
MDNFIAGYAYGITTVIVGQPLDTIKTRMQALGLKSASATAKNIFANDGVPGLYRGGVPLFFGGGLIRSAQFGVYETVLALEKKYFGECTADQKLLGIFNPQVIVAGFAGGIGRGLVEGPFEYIKTRRQVNQSWLMREVFTGSGATVFRNSFLFCFFMIYVDLTKQFTPNGLGPFWTGAVCSNLAWLTIWPLDITKSQVQSGKFPGQSFASLLVGNIRSGNVFRGLLPGLARSSIANGCSMEVYNMLLKQLKERESTTRS